MRATIQVSVDLDFEYLVARASRRGVLPEVIAREIVSDLECRCVDACRWLDGTDAATARSAVRLTLEAKAETS